MSYFQKVMLYLFFIVDCENSLQHNFLQICSNWLTSRNNKAMQEIMSERESLEFQNFWGGGGHAPRPPRKEGLPKQYPPVMLNYLPVTKFIDLLKPLIFFAR